MGLDQYAEFRKEPTKTFYWRKHAALQEYMERLWVDRTGQDISHWHFVSEKRPCYF